MFGFSFHSKFFSLIWRRHKCRCTCVAAMFDLYSAFNTFEQQRFYHVKQLLWHVWSSPRTHSTYSCCHAFSSTWSCNFICFYELVLSRQGVELSSAACKTISLPRHRATPAVTPDFRFFLSLLTSNMFSIFASQGFFGPLPYSKIGNIFLGSVADRKPLASDEVGFQDLL